MHEQPTLNAQGTHVQPVEKIHEKSASNAVPPMQGNHQYSLSQPTINQTQEVPKPMKLSHQYADEMVNKMSIHTQPEEQLAQNSTTAELAPKLPQYSAYQSLRRHRQLGDPPLPSSTGDRCLSLKCNALKRDPYKGTHACFEGNSKIYEFQTCYISNTIHVGMRDQTGKVVGATTLRRATFKPQELLIINANEKIFVQYNPPAFRQKYQSLFFDGVIYNIVTTKYNDRKLFMWCVQGTDQPLITTAKKGHDLIIHPGCPETLEKALILVKFHTCLVRDLEPPSS